MARRLVIAILFCGSSVLNVAQFLPRIRNGLILLVVAVLGGVPWQGHSMQEPVYEGKPLSYWLEAFEPEGFPGQPNFVEAVDAVRAADTSAVPILLRLLRARDSDCTQKLTRLARKQHLISVRYVAAKNQNWEARQGFVALNRAAVRCALPRLAEICRQDISTGETISTRHLYSIEVLALLESRQKMWNETQSKTPAK